MNNICEHIQNHPQETLRLIGLKNEQLEELLEQAVKLHYQKQKIVESKKVRIILGGGIAGIRAKWDTL